MKSARAYKVPTRTQRFFNIPFGKLSVPSAGCIKHVLIITRVVRPLLILTLILLRTVVVVVVVVADVVYVLKHLRAVIA